MEAFACQINGHVPVSVHSIVLVVNLSDLRLYLGYLGIVIYLPVFPVVIVSIRANIQPQQPAQTKLFLVFFNKPIASNRFLLQRRLRLFLRRDFPYGVLHSLYGV